MQSVVKILQRLDKDKITCKGFNNIGMASEKLYQNTLNRSLNNILWDSVLADDLFFV